MPGTSHDLEGALLNELPVKTFDAVRELVNFYTLTDVISIMLNGPTSELKKAYPRVTEHEWANIVKKVCLTRLTAIRVTRGYPREDVRFLLDMALKCLDCISCNKRIAISNINPSHRYLALWIMTCYKILEDS